LYIHNLTNITSRDIALKSFDKFLQERPPMKYEYGDVVVLMPDNEIGDIFSNIGEKHGFIMDKIHPNQLYRLRDSFVVHYVFVDEFVEQHVSEEFVYNWEVSMGLTEQDMRHTRYIKTFFMEYGIN